MMIRYSDNAAATRQFRRPGTTTMMRRVARYAQMRGFRMPSNSNWGVVHFTAVDQAKLFYKIRRLMPARHRAFGMRQLRSITASQRWGLADAPIRSGTNWVLAFKGGWLPRSCGSIEHQAGEFRRIGEHFSLAVLTECDPSSSYGRATELGIARRMLAPT
jgi:hypothetical protein